MGQQAQAWRSGSGQRVWLSTLIDTFEQISRPERRAAPCDQALIAALRAQLMRPVSISATFVSPYSLRN